jgi:hypothetical protein
MVYTPEKPKPNAATPAVRLASNDLRIVAPVVTGSSATKIIVGTGKGNVHASSR